MNGRALESVLDQLHALAAEALTTELRQHMEQLALNPERVEAHEEALATYEAALAEWEAGNKDPEAKPKAPPALQLYSVPPQFLDKVLKYLASNGITAPASAPRVDALAEKLSKLDLSDPDLTTMTS